MGIIWLWCQLLILPKAIKYRLKTLKEVPIIVWGRENFQRLPNQWRKLAIPDTKNVSGTNLCRLVGGLLAKCADFWLSGRHVPDMSATFPAKITFICCGCAYVWFLTTLPLFLLTKVLDFTQTSAYLPQSKQKLGVVLLEAVDPIKWAPASLSDMYTISPNLHMLWKCLCMSPYRIPAALVDQAFVICQEIRFPPKGQTTAKWGSWGCRPI